MLTRNSTLFSMAGVPLIFVRTNTDSGFLHYGGVSIEVTNSCSDNKQIDSVHRLLSGEQWLAGGSALSINDDVFSLREGGIVLECPYLENKSAIDAFLAFMLEVCEADDYDPDSLMNIPFTSAAFWTRLGQSLLSVFTRVVHVASVSTAALETPPC